MVSIQINENSEIFELSNLGVEVAPAHQALKKLQMNHLGLYTLHDLSHSRPQLLQIVKKKKGGGGGGGHAGY